MTRVLGLDPGTATTGFGVVESDGNALRLVEYGAIITPANLPMPERLRLIYLQLNDLLARARVDAAAVEKLFFNKNVTTALSVGQGRGVALLAAAMAGVAVFEYTPLEVKQAMAGYGRATKDQVQQMVRMILNLDDIPRPDDAADALAIAICHLQSARMREVYGIPAT
ncbi:MAG: crossover junction endodeoxyribonuclease RuvC [Chloroflexi bacterium]|nr:crossover junction endodeoxyribonuclease RuvC [Chloroflexota bacterium]MBI3733629.1 crossover junction endodeoxyribonuclease RuvC [Chloroflexota bacterium]